MTLAERFTAHARDWNVTVQETRTTETSRLGFGTRGTQPVVLKVIRTKNSEEWMSGAMLAAFGGAGLIHPIACEPGAVLLPRLVPGHDLVSLCRNGRDEEATEVIASLIQRMAARPVELHDGRPIAQVQSEFAKFRDGGRVFLPASYVDRAEELFAELCATQRDARLLHGDLHHYNVLFDEHAGWIAIDPWGVAGETEFELGASLRNPIDAPELLGDPRVIERRLRAFETALKIDADRALKWAFATTVLCILWETEPAVGLHVREPFTRAARSMLRLLQ